MGAPVRQNQKHSEYVFTNAAARATNSGGGGIDPGGSRGSDFSFGIRVMNIRIRVHVDSHKPESARPKACSCSPQSTIACSTSVFTSSR
jgi:hypothetical protein